jgi:hypothetical protein
LKPTPKRILGRLVIRVNELEDKIEEMQVATAESRFGSRQVDPAIPGQIINDVPAAVGLVSAPAAIGIKLICRVGVK